MNQYSKFDESHESIGFVFWQTHMLWSRQIKKALSPYKLTHTQFVILSVVGYLSQQQAEVNQVDISEASKIDTMTISTSIKTLIKNGYLIRQKSAKDSRAYQLELTQEGHVVLSESMKIVEAVDTHFFETREKESTDLGDQLLKLIRDNDA